jgi:hypothetical protein
VAIRAGTPPASPGNLSHVADLRDEGIASWAVFVGSYGLPEYDQSWVVPMKNQWVGPLYQPDYERLICVPINALQRVAMKAAVLLAADKVRRGVAQAWDEISDFPREHGFSVEDEAFRTHFRRMAENAPTWYPEGEEHYQAALAGPDSDILHARRVISWGISDALRQVEAAAIAEPGRHDVPDTWALYTRGCLPLMVLKHFVHKHRHVPGPVMCVVCGKRVPPRRIAGRYVGDVPGAHYCSDRCRERQKKRKYRERQR